MKEIRRYDINEDWAHAGIIQAGDYCFINYCARNIGGTIEEQIDGAFDEMEERLALVGLTLENVVQMNYLFKNIWDIPVMEKVIERRFHGKYPVRKSFQTEFADPGNLFFQVDGIAYSTVPSVNKGIHGRKRIHFSLCRVAFIPRTSSTRNESALQRLKWISTLRPCP